MKLAERECGLGLTEVKQEVRVERALVVGASGGIGEALCAGLRARGAEVVGLSRRVDGLELTDEGSVRAVMAGLAVEFDTVFIATGALMVGGAAPEKSLRSVEAAGLAAQFAVNAVGPLLVLKHLLPVLPRGRAVRVGVLSARVGSIGDNGLGGWYGYRAAKAALNQLVRSVAIEWRRSHPDLVLACLHPGTVATGFTANYQASHPTVAPDVAAGHLLAVLDGLTPAQSGGFFDWRGEAVPW